MKKNILKGFYAVLFMFIGLTGCEEDTITPDPPIVIDTNQVNFNNLIISEGTILSNITFSAVDLYKGVVVVDSNRLKDANLVTRFTAPQTYYFASGDIFDNQSAFVPGYLTKFRLVYASMTQEQFDTVTVIRNVDSLLVESDFNLDSTQAFGNPLTTKPVYGFYLKGKYDNGYTPRRVYGLMFIDSTYNDAGGFKLKFDLKTNRNGENKFKVQ